MTTDEARELKERWGYAGPAPGDDWVWCSWCGEPWPPKPGYWHNRRGRHICRACGLDRKRGHGRPHHPKWHQKNRWTPDGTLLRRCARCGKWKPIERYHVTRKRGEAIQAHAFCMWCMNHPKPKYLRARKRTRTKDNR